MNSTLLPNDFLSVTTDFNAIPRRWRWHYRALTRLRESLLRQRREHSTEAGEAHERGGRDAIDRAVDEQEHETLLAELAAECSALAEVEAALMRLQLGTYGICEETGRPISASRLKVIPWTRYCRAAAAAREQPQRRVH